MREDELKEVRTRSSRSKRILGVRGLWERCVAFYHDIRLGAVCDYAATVFSRGMCPECMHEKSEFQAQVSRPERGAIGGGMATDRNRPERPASIPENVKVLSQEEIQQTLEDLRVHQVELEMQNEELLRTRGELDALRARYFNLYDMAPVGYVTVSAEGLILEGNLTAATLLKMPRAALVKQPFSRFIQSENQDAYYSRRNQLFDMGTPQGWEARMVKSDGTAFWAGLETTLADDADGVPVGRIVIRDITERKHAEESSNDAYRRLESIIEGTRAGTWEWNVQTGETVFNDIWASIIGYTLDELSPISIKTWSRFAHPDDLKASGELLARHFAGVLPYYDFECQMRHKDGRWIWVHDRGKVVTWTADGKPLRMFGTHQDITERKMSEERLINERSLLCAVINAIPDEIVVKDLERRFVVVNPPSLRALGKTSAGEVLGKRDEDLMPKEFAEVNILEEEQLFLTGISALNLERQGRLDPTTGEPTRVMLASKSPILDQHGNVTGLVVANRDITVRKRAEIQRDRALEVLRKSENRLRDIIFSLGDWVWETDEHGVYTYCSQKGIDLLGSSREEIIGKTPFDFMPPEEQKRVAGIFSEIAAKKAPIKDLENWNTGKNGERICFLTNAVPVLDEQGNLKGYRGVDKDITERRLAEEAMRQMEVRLRQSEKMKAIGLLAGGIAHDFNNVLGGIIGFTGMSLRYAANDSHLKSNLLKVLKAADRAKDLVQQILTYSRQGGPLKTVTPIEPIVKEVVDLLRASIPSSVTIQSELHNDVRSVLADATKLHEMVLNLATNAVHAMDQKGTLAVRLYAEGLDRSVQGRTGEIAAGDYTVIEVADTGCGMDSVTLSKAFDPFFTTKAVGEGTGMGLSVVFGVVQSHGGGIQVESVVGKGTTFKVYLPATTRQVPDVDEVDELAPVTGSEMILFVDDEQMLVEIAEKELGLFGFTVIGMSSSHDALEFIRDHGTDIDILITDQTMPGLTGLELATEALKIRNDLPIILCTGYSREIDPEKAEAVGIRRFVMKPIGSQDLGRAIRNVLDAKKKDLVRGKILVMDDDEIMRDMIVQLLSEAGYVAESAPDGRRGLKLLETRPFDLIVTDMVMPDKEGLETILAIRKKNKTVPIIAISGGGKLGPERYLPLAREFGANVTFQKPFDNERFLEAVQKCLVGIQE